MDPGSWLRLTPGRLGGPGMRWNEMGDRETEGGPALASATREEESGWSRSPGTGYATVDTQDLQALNPLISPGAS